MNKLTLSILLSTLLFNTACRKFVEIDPPKALLVSTNTFKTDATANSALAGIYIQMVNKGSEPLRLSLYSGLEADELKTAYNIYDHLYKNALEPLTSFTNDVWLSAYNYIYQANAVFEGCNSSATLSPVVKKQLMAESMFIRAFWYFYLVNLYGDVPLVTTTDYQTNAVASRTDKTKVYEQIVADLIYAQNNLNSDYVAGNSVSITAERVRPNRATATSLLARIYLYTANYAEAEKQATSVIDQKAIYDMENISTAFLSGSKEAIWQIMKPAPTLDVNTVEGNNYVLTGKPLAGSSQSTTLTPQLLSSFDSSDRRLTHWIGKVTDGGVDYYYPNKYKVQQAGSVTEHSIVLRLAELYLIRSEARTQLGKISDAIDDIDVVRKRAGIALIKDTNPHINKSDLLSLILTERQRELFAEYAHRWLDLKRTGQIDIVMPEVASGKETNWNNFRQLWPIPQSEISNNLKLIQNPGYN